MNVVMTADGRLVEVQATAEREPFTRDELDGLLDLAGGGIEEIMVAQDDAVAVAACLISRPPRRCCGCCSPPGSAARSGSSVSCATTRRASGRICSCRSDRAPSRSSRPTAGPTGRSRTRSGVVFDPTRIAAQIVTGIGFLGAGAIIVRGINVRGLTTAATLWVVAAIGMAAGTGYYEVAIGAAVLVLVSLGPLKFVSARFISRVRPEEAELAIALKPDGDGAQVLARIEELGGQVNTVEFGDDRTMDVVLRASRRSESARVAELLAKLEGVERVQWRP